jgi:hypothetical protein
MNLRERLRNRARLLFLLGQNPISLAGAVLTTTGAVTLIAFWVYDFVLPGPPHPYIGILIFLILPGIFVLGLILVPIGILLRRRRTRTSGQVLEAYPKVDLREPTVRQGVLLVAFATLLNVLIFGTASFRGVTYMDSTQFCGRTCHTVMTPEFTAYQSSPHAHVDCVECHIGPGAGWFVRSKLSGVRQVSGEHRTMDCVDCHNRPTHAFDLPENAVNKQMSSGVISPELPFIHKKAVELLKVEYSDRDSARRQITDGVNAFYRANYPAVYDSRRTLVQQAADSIVGIYLRNIFPEMKMAWGVHPNNLGHNDTPGCFRCHDGSHVSADGKMITNDCSACHNLLAMEEENPKILTDLGLKQLARRSRSPRDPGT